MRVCGLRRSRYVGLAKTHLQHVATAAALNRPATEFANGNRCFPDPKQGDKVVVNGQRATDGSMTVASISVGKDGLAPPM